MAGEKPDVHAVFNEAIERESEEERSRYLDEACRGDPQMRGRVELLLRAHVDAGGFLGGQFPEAAPTSDQPVAEQPGTMIGPYKLVEEIGEGGMGSVFMALQKEPVRRKVALKVIKPGMDSRQVVSRFEAERQALAMMDHPNIAKVHDGGTTESGRPYFVMELVKGIPITDYCDRYRLTTNDRLELFGEVCRAVQHAHQKGIIHRDLKPSNILVTLLDGKAIPKVIDFGIAKATSGHLTEETLVTAFSQMVGTPMYMSPEQVDLSSADVDTRSDVYSLGVLLYELLTGTTPFDRERIKEASYEEFRRIIREEEPPRPSTRLSTLDAALDTVAEKHHTDAGTRSQQVRGELDWIVMKSLEKDRSRRYESANELAKDVQRYLDDEAVEACPPSTAYRLGKFYRRNKMAFLTTSAFALVLIVGAGVAGWQAVVATKSKDFAKAQEDLAEQRLSDVDEQRKIAEKSFELADKQRRLAKRQADIAEKQRDLAEQQRDVADRNLYLAHMRLAQGDWDAGQIGRLHAMLDSHLPRPDCPDLRGWEWYHFLSECHQDLLTLRGHAGSISSVAFRPDGQRLASASYDGTVKIWDVATGQEVFTLRAHKSNTGYWSYVRSMAWSPDGKRLASGDQDGDLSIWDATTGENILTLRDDNNGIQTVAWSPDGQLLASANGVCRVRIWDAARWNEVRLLGMPGSVPAWRPDGRQLATAGWDGTVRIWDTATWAEVAALRGHDQHHVCWSPDGRHLASGNWLGIKMWDTATWEELPSSCPFRQGDVMAWSPDGGRFITKGYSHCIKIWDVETEKELRTLRGHTGRINSAAWSPNGQRLATAGDDRTVKLWDVSIGQKPLLFNVHAGVVSSVAWSPDGRHLASAGEDQTVKIWEAATGKEILTFGGHTGIVYSAAWSPDGKFLASASSDKTVKIWDAGTADEILTIPRMVEFVAWNPNGQRLAGGTAHHTPSFFLWDRTTGDEIVVLREKYRRRFGVAWSPDGEQFAIASNGPVHVRDAVKGVVVRTLGGSRQGNNYRTVTWSADGRRLAAYSVVDDAIVIWSAASGKRTACAKGHAGSVQSLAWSPDSRRLVSTSEDGTLKIWDVATGQEIVTLYEHLGAHRSVAWSPDGRRLASAGNDGTIKIWDASPGYQFARSPEYWIDRGYRLAAGNQYEEAIELYRKLAEDFPEVSTYRESLAECLVKAGRSDESIPLLKKLAEDFPDVPKYHCELGHAYRKKSEYEQAITAYSKAIDVKPDDAAALTSRALCYREQGHWDTAFADMSAAIQMDPENPILPYYLALAHTVRGNLGEYRDTCADTWSKFRESDDPEKQFWLAWTCALAPDAIPDLSAAVSLAAQAVEGDPAYLGTLGAILYRAGRFEDAIERLHEADGLVEDPRPGRSSSPAYGWYFLAMAHHKLGHDAEAEKWLDKATQWTDRVMREHEEGTITLSWNRRLTLRLLREEARQLLKGGTHGPVEDRSGERQPGESRPPQSGGPSNEQ